MPESSELFKEGVCAHEENIRAQLGRVIDPTDEAKRRSEQAERDLAKVWLGPLTEQMDEMEAAARERLSGLFKTIKEFEVIDD